MLHFPTLWSTKIWQFTCDIDFIPNLTACAGYAVCTAGLLRFCYIPLSHANMQQRRHHMTTRGLKLSSFSLNDMYTSCFLHLLNESADVPLRNYSLTHC